MLGMLFASSAMYTTDQAYQAGRWAREANRPPSSCPMYAMGDDGMKLREGWRKGWAEADRELRK